MTAEKPLSELEQYKPLLTAQPDFDTFWAQSIIESNNQPLNATLKRVEYPVERVDVYRLTYDGFNSGARINGWYIVPKRPLKTGKDGKSPIVIQFPGYNSGKGRPASYLHWALQGYYILAVDVRGQSGESPDNQTYPGEGAANCMTKGIIDPKTYYYRYVYLDCLRAINFVRSQSVIGPIILNGGSQGGGLALAVGALGADQGIVATMPDAPYLAHFSRSIEIFAVGPYQELVNYWKEYPRNFDSDLKNLSYFDGLNFAPHIKCPVLLSTGLLDNVCPPSTAFAVFNHLVVQKEMKVYPFNGHEAGGVLHDEEKYKFAVKFI